MNYDTENAINYDQAAKQLIVDRIGPDPKPWNDLCAAIKSLNLDRVTLEHAEIFVNGWFKSKESRQS